MDENFMIYAGALLAIVICFIIIKKVASCLIRTVVGLVVLAIIAYVYYMYMR
ncbi:MAG: sulfate transporter [Prevotella sp.]|nr:sulfate transporter [Prevotella sp.]